MGIRILSFLPWVRKQNKDKSEKLTEAFDSLGIVTGSSVAIDPDDHLFRRLTEASRELPALTTQRAINLAWSLYESNPLAHGIIETIKDHVVGKGFEVHASSEEAQKVIDKHWNDYINNWDLKQHDRVRDLALFGELLLLAFVNEADGRVRLSSVDPGFIRAAYTRPDNPEVVDTIIVNSKRHSDTRDVLASDKIYKVIQEDEDIGSPTYGLLTGNKPDETFSVPGSKKVHLYDGCCFYFTINRVTGAIRGRSDIMSAIDWIDAHDQILFNFVDRTLLMNCFVWDVTLKGANQTQIEAWQARHATTPKPGTVNVHNEGEEWDEVSPKMNQQDFSIQQSTVKGQSLAAVGLPPHWFGESDVNRASAENISLPALTRLKARQLYIKYLIEYVIQFVLDCAVAKGTLPKPDVETEGEKYQFEVHVPEMSQKSIATAGATLLNIVQAIVIAIRSNIIDLPEAMNMFSLIAMEMGADINLEAMKRRMQEAGILDEKGNSVAPPAMADDMGNGMNPIVPPVIGNDGQPHSPEDDNKNIKVREQVLAAELLAIIRGSGASVGG